MLVANQEDRMLFTLKNYPCLEVICVVTSLDILQLNDFDLMSSGQAINDSFSSH